MPGPVCFCFLIFFDLSYTHRLIFTSLPHERMMYLIVCFHTRSYVVRTVHLSSRPMAQCWLVGKEAMADWDKEIQMTFMC